MPVTNARVRTLALGMGMARCDFKAADEALVHSALKAAHALAAPRPQRAKKRRD